MIKKILATLGISSALVLGGFALKGTPPAPVATPTNYIDYKLSYVTMNDNHYITEIGVIFYEGNFETVKETDPADGKTKDVVRYVRSKRFSKAELAVSATRKARVNKANQQIIVYTDNDFGQATNTDQLKDFLDKELAKNVTKEPLTQTIVDQNIINEKAI